MGGLAALLPVLFERRPTWRFRFPRGAVITLFYALIAILSALAACGQTPTSNRGDFIRIAAVTVSPVFLIGVLLARDWIPHRLGVTTLLALAGAVLSLAVLVGGLHRWANQIVEGTLFVVGAEAAYVFGAAIAAHHWLARVRPGSRVTKNLLN